jgi:hypothetical protein
MNNESKNKETDASASGLGDLLCELKKTVASFESDYEYAVKTNSKQSQFYGGRCRGAEHIIAIFERYISTIT